MDWPIAGDWVEITGYEHGAPIGSTVQVKQVEPDRSIIYSFTDACMTYLFYAVHYNYKQRKV